MTKIINPQFEETAEQRKFRQTYMMKVHAAYRFHDSIGIMDLGEDKKISLQDIYVPLRFSNTELDESRDWEKQDDTYSLIDVLKEPRELVLSGRPGSGKTTISRMIINLLSSRALTGLTEQCGRRMPLYFKLRDYDIKDINSAVDLLDRFIESQGATLQFNISREHIEFYLKKGWCFLIFDGVDEVGGLKNRLKIRQFILDYFSGLNRQNYLLVTSRPSGLENASFSNPITKDESVQNINWLKLYYVDSFNKSQVQEFSRKWYALREENPATVKAKSDEFMHDIEKIKSLSTLKRRPIFITIMAHIHTTKAKLPHSRAMAYEYMVQAYIEILDNTRRLHKTMYKEEKFIEWSFEDKIRLLQSIAYKLHTSESKDKKEDDSLIVVDRKELLTIIETIIKENKERWETIQPDHAESLLKFYLTRTGLLHEPEEGKIQFSHLSFQEFLTARFIYKKLIEENLFQAPKVINREIVPRLNYNRWQEVILLFFSLNKEAANDILKMMEALPETQKEGLMYDAYNELILKMLDSDEYGVKDSDMGYWVEKVIHFSVSIDSKFGEDDRSEKGVRLIKIFFQSGERKSKIESAKKILEILFDEYFSLIKKDSSDKTSRNNLENVLYFINYSEDLVRVFKTRIESAMPVLLERKKFDTQFLVSYELFTFYFREFADHVAKIYNIDESIVSLDFLSLSTFTIISNDSKQKYWLKQLLEWEWVIENLSSFSDLKSLKKTVYSIIERKNKSNLAVEFFGRLDEVGDPFYRKNWVSDLWHDLPGGVGDAQTRCLTRMLSNSIDALIIGSGIKKMLANFGVDNDFMRNLNKKMGKTVFLYKLISLFAIFFKAYSHIEFIKNYRKIENPWKTYDELKEFYPLLCKPEALYNHLCQISTMDLGEKEFIAQYNEYDLKPYAMRKMVKYILDKREENYPTFSSEEALERSKAEIKMALDSIPVDVRKKIEREIRREKLFIDDELEL